MPNLPASTNFTGATVTEGQFKAAITDLREYLAGLFGVDGSKATALGTLGAATPADFAEARADTEADKIAAQAAAASAQAAWTAALAANPDLDPAVRMNPSTLSADLTIPAFYNAYSAGPLTIGESVEVTLNDNSNWSIL